MLNALLVQILLSSHSHAAYDKAPTEKVICSAGINSANNTMPQSAIASVRFVLESQQLQKSWKSVIQKIEITPRYQNHYINYWIAPWETIPIFAEKNILSKNTIPNGEINFQIRRFDANESRVAGIAVEYNVQSGFFGGILIRPSHEGFAFTHLSPIKLADGNLFMSFHCVLESIMTTHLLETDSHVRQ